VAINRAVEHADERQRRATCLGLAQQRILIVAALEPQGVLVVERPDGVLDIRGTAVDDVLPPLAPYCGAEASELLEEGG
jgi:hypothetical protein